jgi:8-amino-7-oxononanoate synthase
MNENFLKTKLEERSRQDALRSLRLPGIEADYFSNDYLGLVKNKLIEGHINEERFMHGSTGSRLLAGNYKLIEETEKEIASFHQTEAALIFNSGFDANLGLLSCVALKGDVIFYDQLVHASIRDGIRLSMAHSFSFVHNNLADLEKKLKNKRADIGGRCFVITESVFSMDGDKAPLTGLIHLCEKYDCLFILDEAHATGVIGDRGEGCAQQSGIGDRCFARMHSFGKALGCHGAVIVGSFFLRQYLINFCRTFIYTTALPASSVAAIRAAYHLFPGMQEEREHLKKLIALFDKPGFKHSETPIQCYIASGNSFVKALSEKLLLERFDVRPILYPTVPAGQERLRITLHSYNLIEETRHLISTMVSG